jgi:prolyl-tRNA editing enzyme YbaK/EbsC (Cys-tRNA(Pro) deacylase)
MSPEDLQAYIITEGITARLVRDLGDTRTVPLAAEALGVRPEQIIKSLLFLVKLPERKESLQPVLVIVGGDCRVDYRAIGARFGVSRKKVRMASAEVVLEVTGYPAGGVPPFGHRTPIPVMVDAALLAGQAAEDATVYGGGGDEGTMLEVTVAELLRVLHPEVLRLSLV